MSIGRRSSQDKRWQEVKQKVRERDKSDRMLRIVTPLEYVVLKKKAGPLINILDPAHYKAVSELPSECYTVSNICLLNRWSHENLDNFRDPVDGHPISKEEVRKWWERIIKSNKDQYQELKDKGLI